MKSSKNLTVVAKNIYQYLILGEVGFKESNSFEDSCFSVSEKGNCFKKSKRKEVYRKNK